MKKLPFSRDRLSTGSAYLLTFLFVYTASSKLLDWELFNAMLSKSPLIGSKSAIIAWAVPFTELLLAALLLLSKTRLAGLYGALTLLIVFTVYIGYMVAFVPHLPCSCGGVIRYMSWRMHLLFNLVFIIVAMTGIIVRLKTIYPPLKTGPIPGY